MRLLRPITLLTVVLALTLDPLAPPRTDALSAQSRTAQSRVLRVLRDASVRATPEGTLIGTLTAGTTWSSSTTRGGFTLVTVEAWVAGSRFAGRRDSFPESIGGTGTLRMRADPSLSGRILGVFEAGAGVRVVERSGNWARVRRDGWVLSTALAAATATPTKAVTPAPSRTKAANPRAREEVDANASVRESSARAGSTPALRARRGADLSAAPGAPAIGRLEAGAVVEPVARDRGWVRVRVDAWMPESLLVPTDTSFRATVTAAELRLDPAGSKGRIVRWDVQVVGLQQADPLRKDMAPDEPYLLAMGPSGENAILYLALPPSLVAQARALASLAEVTITARVRTGRSEPTGVPVLDVISIVKR